MNNKSQFNTSAFKQAIKDFDSFYEGDNSNLIPSTEGSYRFKYDDVKNLPEFKGVSKRVFLANKDMQDKAMDLAIDGKMPGRKGYDRTAYELKNKYNTKLRADEIAALSHIIGEEKTENFLANPNANNSAGISTQQLVQTLDKFNTAQGTDPSYRTKPKTQPQQTQETQEQVQMPMPEEAMEQPMEQMQNVQPVQMPVEPAQPVMPEGQPLDTSAMPEVEVTTEQMDPANQQLQQMTGVDGANPMAKGGNTDSFSAHYMHKGDRKILARDEDAHFRLKDAGYGHRKLAEGGYADRASSLENLMNSISSSSTDPSTEPSTEKREKSAKSLTTPASAEDAEIANNAEIEALLPSGKYSNRQQQAQRDTIRAIKQIYGNNVDQKTINNILGNVEIETGWGTLKEGAWSNDFLESKKDDPQYKSIVNNWKKYNNASKDNDYSSLSSKDKLSVMYYGDTNHSNFAGGRGVLQLTAADYGGNQNTEQEIRDAAEQLGLDPATNSTDFYNSTLLTLQTYKNRGHDFSTYDSAQSARTGAVNPYERYEKLPQHKKDTLLNYSNLENNSSVNPEVIANSNMLSPVQKEKMMATNNAGKGVPNEIAANLSQEVESSSAPSTFSQAMNFTTGVSPAVQQSLDELSMETHESPRLAQFAKGGMIKRADGSYSKRGLWDNIRAAKGSGKKPTKQMLAQERKINKKALGGSVGVTKGGTQDLIQFEGGGTHEQNPLGGIPIGMNNQGQMNSVEEGESKYSFKDGDYVFSNRIKI